MQRLPASFWKRTQMSVWMYSTRWPIWIGPLAYGKAEVTRMRRGIGPVGKERQIGTPRLYRRCPEGGREAGAAGFREWAGRASFFCSTFLLLLLLVLLVLILHLDGICTSTGGVRLG